MYREMHTLHSIAVTITLAMTITMTCAAGGVFPPAARGRSAAYSCPVRRTSLSLLSVPVACGRIPRQARTLEMRHLSIYLSIYLSISLSLSI